MKIVDTVPYFLNNYEPNIQFLKSYYMKYPKIFNEYFAYHCKNTEERHLQSLEKYPLYLDKIEKVHQNIVPIIQEISNSFIELYKIVFPIEVQLIVGGFGSNAYTHRQIIPNITFALERLSPVPDHLRAIVAHEFGHCAHNIISHEAGMDWSKLNWVSPLIWINQEGAATYFSRKTAPGLHPSIYFSYNNDGYEWLLFAEDNMEMIKREFVKDLSNHSLDEFWKEWFSIRGGKNFGFDRLGYYVADMFFKNQIHQLGEYDAIIAWKRTNFEETVNEWLHI